MKKSVTIKNKWVKWLLIGMGIVFLIIAVVLASVASGNHVYVNGVQVANDAQGEQLARRLFLLGFGIPGLLLLVAGSITILVAHRKQVRINALLAAGNYVWAGHIALVASNTAVVTSNSQHHQYAHTIQRMTCVYEDEAGRKYLFKGPTVRYDSTPFLHDGQVKVYLDTDNVHNYYVDLENSMDEVIEA
ncbi:hypothetical protein ACFQ4L_05925 [Lapidilactobacillus mulanensis]|uniref:Uncharacterized protein n=1 Tax=Lapidilactobacillus mulanensis TaxID=2485999 RepID=A0ABW4DP81_9LACO|nr:hypothetical protein [Lapidilactobacillus mulanensis]